MTINATILLQALNFFIAYILLRELLLKPAIQLLDLQQATRDGVRKTIEQYEAVIDRKKRQKQEQWMATRDHVARNMPVIQPEVMVTRVAVRPVAMPEVSPQEIDTLTCDVTNELVKQVSEK